MSYQRVFTPNAVGNLAFLIGLVGGNALDEEVKFEDWNVTSGALIGDKDLTGWSSFTLKLSRNANDSTTILTKTWTATDAVVGAASGGTIRVYLTSADTSTVQASGYTHGFAALEGVNPAGDTKPLEQGRWHLQARPGA